MKNEWQPIETAPKDGRWIWFGCNRQAERRSFSVSAYRWDESHSPTGGWFSGMGWWHQVGHAFTHWCEMAGQPPAPPLAQEGKPE